MKFGLLVATLLMGILLMVVGCREAEDIPKNVEKLEDVVLPSSSGFGLSSLEEFENLMKFANEREDINAMKHLSDYFGYELQQTDMSLYWLERAANAGDVDSRENVIGHYSSSLEESEKQKAKMLAEKWKCKLVAEDAGEDKISIYRCPKV